MIAATGGCFSFGVTTGHLALIQFCRSIAKDDEVHVYINSDEWIKKNKPDRFIYTEEERVSLISALRDVDDVVVFYEDTPEAVIATRKPDIWVKSTGWQSKDDLPETKIVEGYGGSVILFESPVDISTTRILERLRRGKNKVSV